jgi:BirA family biotin operon repressor/biotin-[acetyl-CoA-carboxylase] ligase
LYNISANTIFTGKTVINLPTCHSTNDFAAQLAGQTNPAEGTLIITPHQTAGKGQRGNSWEAAPGKNLTFSIIFKPSFLKISEQFYLNIITSLAVQETVKQLSNHTIHVKWPNDIYFQDRKICGILIQNIIKKDSIGVSVIGIGLNINQETFSDKKAFSLKNILEHEQDPNWILNLLLENLEKRYLQLKQFQFEKLHHDYISALYRVNEPHQYKADNKIFTGIIKGISSIGLLNIETDNEVRSFNFKEIEFL